MQIFLWISCFMFYIRVVFFFALHVFYIKYIYFCCCCIPLATYTLFFILHCIRNGCALAFLPLHSFFISIFSLARSFHSASLSSCSCLQKNILFFVCSLLCSSIAIFFICLCIEKLFVLQFNMLSFSLCFSHQATHLMCTRTQFIYRMVFFLLSLAFSCVH